MTRCRRRAYMGDVRALRRGGSRGALTLRYPKRLLHAGTRRWVRLGAFVSFLVVAAVAWQLWPRDQSESRCRGNLGMLYVAAGRVVTGEDPEPPPPVRDIESYPPPPPLADLSAGDVPALEEVFRKLVSDFSLTPEEDGYLTRVEGRDEAHAGWTMRMDTAGELVCPREPAYERKAGYIGLARSWTDLYDLPPPSYEWHPEPDVLARCMWHRLELLRDGSIREY
ncbi:MAG: hypothetical protein JSV65_06110 [Armatimonadota bacterium]|nr:MAG: hypothetical protein JSV65_06110 [Armatimonadota bacterium]